MARRESSYDLMRHESRPPPPPPHHAWLAIAELWMYEFGSAPPLAHNIPSTTFLALEISIAIFLHSLQPPHPSKHIMSDLENELLGLAEDDSSRHHKKRAAGSRKNHQS
jgi:hypothetical protein